jgi:hypothetical protein
MIVFATDLWSIRLAGSASRAVRCLKLQSHQICQGFAKDLKHLERDLQIGHSTLQPFHSSSPQPFNPSIRQALNHSTLQPFHSSSPQPFNSSTLPFVKLSHPASQPASQLSRQASGQSAKSMLSHEAPAAPTHILQKGLADRRPES